MSRDFHLPKANGALLGIAHAPVERALDVLGAVDELQKQVDAVEGCCRRHRHVGRGEAGCHEIHGDDALGRRARARYASRPRRSTHAQPAFEQIALAPDRRQVFE
jgi:hypothetical protein